MANVIIEYLVRKFSLKNRVDDINKMTENYEKEFYDPIHDYEWLDAMKRRQREHMKRKY